MEPVAPASDVQSVKHWTVRRVPKTFCIHVFAGFPGEPAIKNLSANAGNAGDMGWIPWSREWQLAPVFLPRKLHRQKNLAGYSSWGHERVGHN